MHHLYMSGEGTMHDPRSLRTKLSGPKNTGPSPHPSPWTPTSKRKATVEKLSGKKNQGHETEVRMD